MSEPPIEGFKALAHPLRYRILAALANGERNVGEIEEASRITQPGLSQQLAVLRKAELVNTRREAKQVYYAVADGELARILRAIESLIPANTATEGTEQSLHRRRTGAAVFAQLGRGN